MISVNNTTGSQPSLSPQSLRPSEAFEVEMPRACSSRRKGIQPRRVTSSLETVETLAASENVSCQQGSAVRVDVENVALSQILTSRVPIFTRQKEQPTVLTQHSQPVQASTEVSAPKRIKLEIEPEVAVAYAEGFEAEQAAPQLLQAHQAQLLQAHQAQQAQMPLPAIQKAKFKRSDMTILQQHRLTKMMNSPMLGSLLTYYYNQLPACENEIETLRFIVRASTLINPRSAWFYTQEEIKGMLVSKYHNSNHTQSTLSVRMIPFRSLVQSHRFALMSVPPSMLAWQNMAFEHTLNILFYPCEGLSARSVITPFDAFPQAVLSEFGAYLGRAEQEYLQKYLMLQHHQMQLREQSQRWQPREPKQRRQTAKPTAVSLRFAQLSNSSIVTKREFKQKVLEIAALTDPETGHYYVYRKVLELAQQAFTERTGYLAPAISTISNWIIDSGVRRQPPPLVLTASVEDRAQI